MTAAKQEGAELVTGGGSAEAVFERGHALGGGYWIQPTIYTGVNNHMRLAREEIFGPLTAVIPFDDEEEAIAIANDSEYGLAAAAWTNDLKRAVRVSSRIRVGAM
jgi:acyl-CoA reductase-like NAD-dependent aldehyde dehydrogenase